MPKSTTSRKQRYFVSHTETVTTSGYVTVENAQNQDSTRKKIQKALEAGELDNQKTSCKDEMAYSEVDRVDCQHMSKIPVKPTKLEKDKDISPETIFLDEAFKSNIKKY